MCNIDYHISPFKKIKWHSEYKINYDNIHANTESK